MYRFIIFDLDGTLLNTLDDLADAANHVCQAHGWPTHETEAYKYFVGNGIPKLVERFTPKQARTPWVLEQAQEEFMAYYARHKEDKTAPYPGLLQAVEQLKAAGLSLAVLSNKTDSLVRPVMARYYPELFPLVQGALPGLPTKPDPSLLRRLMKRMGANDAETLLVGDSDVDILTAKNGGVRSCGVLWGFRTREELEQAGASLLAETPEELVRLILN
ncbi:MAG: HAD-IA family hydrolase [Clostridium sp.]|nr:HAD-IA family hydrolase [Clostridium sp.]